MYSACNASTFTCAHADTDYMHEKIYTLIFAYICY